MPEPTSKATVQVHWDAEASVWWAESADIPGLVAEAATVEALISELRLLVPELLRLNSVPHVDRIEIAITADRIEAIELVVGREKPSRIAAN